MTTKWSTKQIQDELKRGKRCLVVKTLRGDFKDLTREKAALMQGMYTIEESRFEVIITDKPTPPPEKKKVT